MKILCIQLRQMGDVIMTTPAVRQLRAVYPEAEIVFMTEPLGANVYKNNPHISRLWSVPRKQCVGESLKLFWEVYREGFDLVVDFFSNPKSAQITWASRAKERVGFDFTGRRYAYTRSVALPDSKEYAAKSKNRLIEHLGGDLDDVETLFNPDETARNDAREFAETYAFGEKCVAFCVVSRRDYKLLPPEFFAKVGDGLIGQGYRLFFVYGPGEKDMADAVYGLLTNKEAGIIEYDMPDIQQLAAILGHCRVYVGNDGGSKHLSVCAGIPTVTVFHEVKAENWTPPGHTAFQVETGVLPEEVIRSVAEIVLKS